MSFIVIYFFFFFFFFFFFNMTATTEIYTLSLHDALPFSTAASRRAFRLDPPMTTEQEPPERRDRKSTRLNSSHVKISYAVLCSKKKNKLFKVPSCLQSSSVLVRSTLSQLTQ